MESCHASIFLTPRTTLPLDEMCEAMEQDANSGIDGCRSESVTPEDKGRKYEFRGQNRTVISTMPTTWLDKDDTGNYDPDEERRKERKYRNQIRLRPQRLTLPKNRLIEGGEEGNEADDESLPKVAPRIMVRLIFHSEDQTEAFRQLAAQLSAKSEVDNEVRATRKRTRAVAFQYDDNYKTSRARNLSDLPADPTGHPSARGCWECIRIGHECSLLSDEHSWPCVTCGEDNHDCHLVIPPIRKRACERCCRRRKNNACSYTYTLNHGEACQQCCDEGFSCVAGPAKETVRTRIRLDKDWVNKHLPTKKKLKAAVVECKDCSDNGRKCSLVDTGREGGACTACIATGEPCTLESLIPFHGGSNSKPSPRSKSTKKLLEEEIIAPTPPLPRRNNTAAADTSADTTGFSGLTKTIDTKFCHPIEFNYDGDEQCHFCVEPGFPLFGLDAKSVEVIEWTDGRGLEEIHGGHKGDGLENTRMCLSCTFSRLPIITCLVHNLRPIKGIEATAMGLNAAFENIFSGTTTNERWCAICPDLARYECCTPSEEGEGEGCGLGVCERCMVILSGVHDGDLQAMLEELKDEQTESKPMGLRADWELLKQHGLLMRYVMWSTGQGE